MNQTVNSAYLGCSQINVTDCENKLTSLLSELLAPLFSNVKIRSNNCSILPCNISYTASFESYKQFNGSEIQDFIVNRTSRLGSVLSTSSKNSKQR